MDEGRHPTAEAYEASLPDGWASYPACRARASLLAGLAGIGVLEGLPAPLEAWVARLARETWIPEVVHVGVIVALRDVRFRPGSTGEDDFVAWLTKLNREVMPYLPGEAPEGVLRRLTGTFAALHEGTTLVLTDAGSGHARLEAGHPPNVFPPLMRRCRRVAMLAYLSRAGAVQPDAIERDVPGGSVAEITWR